MYSLAHVSAHTPVVCSPRGEYSTSPISSPTELPSAYIVDVAPQFCLFRPASLNSVPHCEENGCGKPLGLDVRIRFNEFESCWDRHLITRVIIVAWVRYRARRAQVSPNVQMRLLRNVLKSGHAVAALSII